MGEDVFRVARPSNILRLPSRIGICFALLAILYFASQKIVQNIPQDGLKALFHPSSSTVPRVHLHFLLPASEPDLNLCKAFVSSTILGYPTPKIINWGSVGTSQGGDDATRRARQMEKLYESDRYLNGLGIEQQEDLILMADSLDTWFQLPSSLLLQRYHELRKRSQDHVVTTFGKEVACNFSQTIIFSAEKKCWPRNKYDMGCFAVPESPLPKDIYGSQTDLQIPKLDEFRFIRPRYVNSGFVLGPVKDMRKLLARATEMARENPTVYGADQGIIAQILGEQEYMRQTSRSKQTPWKRGKMVDFAPNANRQYEYGIGLDYEQILSLPTAHADNFSQWVTWSDTDDLHDEIHKSSVTEPRVLRGLADDIAGLSPPFADLPDNESARAKSWTEVPLYTNLWTGVTPVSIHLNGLLPGGKKVLREDSWERMWFADHAKELFEVRAQSLMELDSEQWMIDVDGYPTYGIMATSDARKEGYGAETIDANGAVGWIRWDELCDAASRRKVFGSE